MAALGLDPFWGSLPSPEVAIATGLVVTAAPIADTSVQPPALPHRELAVGIAAAAGAIQVFWIAPGAQKPGMHLIHVLRIEGSQLSHPENPPLAKFAFPETGS